MQPRKSCSQPDGLYAYFVCFCGFLSILIAVGCSYSYGLLFPALLDEFKEGKAKTGKVTYPCVIDRCFISFVTSGEIRVLPEGRDLSRQIESKETRRLVILETTTKKTKTRW